MTQQLVRFGELPPKSEFHAGGNTYVKRSTRTADLPRYARWFYFSPKELCIVGLHSRLAQDYFAKTN